MFELLDDSAEQAMAVASREAQRFQHDNIGAGHILLGILKTNSEGSKILVENLGVVLPELEIETENQLKATERFSIEPVGHWLAKQVIEHAMNEAKSLGHVSIGTDHLLLGLILEGKGIPARIFHALDISVHNLRDAIEERRRRQ